MTLAEASSFAEIVRRVAEEHADVADYRSLSQSMLEEIKGREHELLAKLLPGYVRVVLSRRTGDASDDAAWESFLLERLATEGRGTIFVKDATADDLAAAVKKRRSFAGNLDRRAHQFSEVEQAMRARGAAVVAALPREAGIATLKDMQVRWALLRSERMEAASRARTVTALRTARDKLREWLATSGSPTVAALTERRDELVDLIGDMRLKERRSSMIDEVLRERFPWMAP